MGIAMTGNWMERLTETPEGKRLQERERLWFEAMESITGLMESQGISRTELARRLGVTPAYITKLLRGTHNMTLATLSDVFFVLGHEAGITVKSSPLAIEPGGGAVESRWESLVREGELDADPGA
jgi:transcriptional regulator with XRE-family HTH domain